VLELCTLSQRHSRHAFRRAEHLVADTTTRRPIVVRRLAAPGGRESVNWSENLPMHLTDASPVTRTSHGVLARRLHAIRATVKRCSGQTAPATRRVDLALVDVVLVQQPAPTSTAPAANLSCRR